MENENLEIKKYILTYGGLLGGVSIVFGLMLFFLDMHYQQETSVTVVNVIISVGVIGIAQFTYRKDNEGFMSLGQGIKIGLGASAINGHAGMLVNRVGDRAQLMPGRIHSMAAMIRGWK